MILSSNLSIRRRLVIIIVSIAVITVVIVAFVGLGSSAEALRRQTELSILDQNQRLASQLDTGLQAVSVTTRSLAAALSNTPGLAAGELWHMTTDVLGDQSQLIRWINVYAPQRYNYLPILRDRDFLSTSQTWFIRALFNGQEIWHREERSYNPGTLTPSLSFAVPYRDRLGRIIGVVWSTLDASALNTLMSQTMSTDERRGYSLLVSDMQTVASVYNLRLADASGLALVEQFITQPEIAALLDTTQAANSWMLMPDPFNGRQSVVVVSHLPATGWKLVSVLPGNILQNPVDRSYVYVFIITFMGMSLLGWVVYAFVTQTVSAPLRGLGLAAREVGSGDMRYEFGFQDRGDEIGQLATAMEDMKRNLAYSYRQLSMWSQTLEKRVAERTEQLEAARQEAQTTATELLTVYDASLALVSDYELPTILQRLTETILDLLHASYCAVWLVTSDRQKLQLVATTSPDKNRIGYIIDMQEGMAGLVTRTTEPVIIADYLHWPDRLAGFNDPGIEQAMGVPMMFFKRPIGSLLVGRKLSDPPFNERDQRLLTLLANLVSPVVRNAQLFIQRDEARKEAERASAVKTRFLASVTHELRTPLNLIINNMDFMRIGTFGEINTDQRMRLSQTIRSAEHLLYLINDLLDVSKIEAGEMELFIQPSDIYPLIEDALDSALVLTEEKETRIQVEAHIPDDLPTIPMDARRVRQVLTNLLTNAVKFTIEGKVTLAVENTGEFLRLSVSDTGIGIPADEMDKLFAAFERTDRAKQLGIEGTGLGLPISRYLVEAHGGQMTVETKVGQGSTFVFTLPLKPASVPQTDRFINAIIAPE